VSKVLQLTAAHLREDYLEPLEVIEFWMRQREQHTQFLGAVCEAIEECLAPLRGNDRGPLSLELQTRLVDDLREAWGRGARPKLVAIVASRAMRGKTEVECSLLGLDDLAVSLTATDEETRDELMSLLREESSSERVWADRLLGAIIERASAAERERYALDLQDRGKPRSRRLDAMAHRLRAGNVA
jgi:hypothetical protein